MTELKPCPERLFLRDDHMDEIANWMQADAGDADATEYIRADLARPEPAVTVKPLEWEEQSIGYWFAKDPLGGKLDYYRAHPHRDGGGWRAYLRDFDTGIVADESTARAAAQADYERRILSAIQATPAPDTRADALREALSGLYSALDSCVDLTPEVMAIARAALNKEGE